MAKKGVVRAVGLPVYSMLPRSFFARKDVSRLGNKLPETPKNPSSYGLAPAIPVVRFCRLSQYTKLQREWWRKRMRVFPFSGRIVGGVCAPLVALTLLLAVSNPVSSAPWGRALRFDGKHSFAQVPAVTGIPTGNAPYTIEFWFRIVDIDLWYFNTVDWYNGIMMCRGSEGPGGVQTVSFINQHIALTHWIPDSDTGIVVEPFRWHHLATTWSGTVECLYIDGVLRWSNSGYSLNTDGGSLTLGKHDNFDDYFFSGEMDELRVWSYARTAEQIAATYAVQIDPATAGLVAYWDFEENEGQVILDHAHGNNGFLGHTTDVEPSDPQRVSVNVPVLVGTIGRSVSAMTSAATTNFRFCFWGVVRNVETVVPPTLPTWFDLEDGSGVTIRATSPKGFADIEPGYYWAVTGRLDSTSSPATLHSRKEQVQRLN